MAGVRDRLSEMQTKSGEKDVAERKKKKNSRVEINMEKILHQVNIIDKALKDIKEKTEEMTKLQRDIISNPFCDKQAMLKCDNTIANIQAGLTDVRKDLRNLEEVKIPNSNDGIENPLIRVREQQLSRLTSELANTTNVFFKQQADYMDKMRDRVRNQLRVTSSHGNMSENEINNLLDDDSYSIFTQNFISDTSDAKTSLFEIEKRQKDILALEKSVFDVNQLFKDINLIVADQGETIDSIEANIVNASVNVVAGGQKLKRANEYQSKARRKKFCIAGIVIIVILVIVLIIVLSIYA